MEGGSVSRDRASFNAARNTNHLIGRLARDSLMDLAPYLNSSAYCLPESFSVKQAYGLFRACGLRHLFVLDVKHHPVGVCTRKDFIGHDMEHRLPKFPDTAFSRQFGSELRRSIDTGDPSLEPSPPAEDDAPSLAPMAKP